MVSSRLIATAVALTAGAEAMWMPPKLKMPEAVSHLMDGKDASTPLGPALTGQDRASVGLTCHECPLAVGNRHGVPMHFEAADGVDSLLRVDITSDGSQLYFNGAPFYPQAPSPISHAITAMQEYEDKETAHPHELYNKALPLTATFEIDPAVKMMTFVLDTPNAKEVRETVPMRRVSIEVLGLAYKSVNVEGLEILFSNDDLKIHDVRVVPSSVDASPAAAQCHNILCRVRVSMQNKVAHLNNIIQSQTGSFRHQAGGKSRHCHKHKLKGHFKGSADKFSDKFDAAFTPDTSSEASSFGPGYKYHYAHHHGHHGHKHHHHHHGAMHRFARATVGFIYHILLPVLFGVAAGMVVSGLGMMLGHAIVFVVRRFMGRSHAGYEVVLVKDPEAFDAECECEEDLPKYEDVYVAPPPFPQDEKEATQ